MAQNLFHFIDTFHDLKVLVIGEAMLDSYLRGESERISREAPVPVVVIRECEDVPGGAANAAVNIHSLGGQVYFLSVIGSDLAGNSLTRELEGRGISTHWVRVDPDRKTLTKQRIIAASQMIVRFDQGTVTPIDAESEDWLIQVLKDLYTQVDAVLISDYGYGMITPRILDAIRRLQNKYPRILIVDSKDLTAYRDMGITAVKPNYRETLELLGLQHSQYLSSRVDLISTHGDCILEMTGAQIAAVTLDQDGALIFKQGGLPYRTYARAMPESKATGAGDTFISALTLALAGGAETEEAAELASAAASVVVEKSGTAACFTEELKGFFSGNDKFVTDAFYLAARVAACRRQNKKIIFTNGCFDILHRGHISYLNLAKTYGDLLIVGINSDDSVRRIKGPHRPINSLEDRGQILAAMSSVDHIIPFDGDNPSDLIRLIQPDVYVKGGDYTRETLPEAALVESYGGAVHILPFIENRSTSNMIERIRRMYAEPSK